MGTYMISELANEFNVSTRTIRYYEERDLIHPLRAKNGTRLYTKKDRTILSLIFKGKRFGFSLEEIQEMLFLFHEDRTGKKQLQKTIEYCRKKEKEVSQKIEDLQGLRREILDVLQNFERRLQDL